MGVSAESGRDRSGLLLLTREQCLQLLAHTSPHVGRVALVDYWGKPLIFPVNYAMFEEWVVFRTGEGSKLDAAVRGAPVAFEVDQVDSLWEEGWSVLVQGVAEKVTDPGHQARLETLPLRTWVQGSKQHWIRIPVTVVSGRRIR
jgi:nitroimidazol reductase NimA-like FMN-containing flavoprotein (pyridoxamine 5'-phosphate oxidase superfamily)